MGIIDSQEQYDYRTATLATNLAIGAALCRAFDLGYGRGYSACPCGEILDDDDWCRIDARHWTPGSRSPAPSSGKAGR